MTGATAGGNRDNIDWMASGGEQYLTFFLADEEYGVDILSVHEIREWQPLTPLPDTPDFIKGVLNLRGTIVPIFDLRERFSLPARAYGPTTVIIVLNMQFDGVDTVMGIIVDGVSDTYNIAAEDIRPCPDFNGAIRARYLRGLAEIDEQLVLILDINSLLDEHQARELVEAADPA